MAESIRDNFARIVALARSKLQEVQSSQEELIPHRHAADKTSVSLTPPWTAVQFLNELDVIFADLIDEEEPREG